MTAEGNVGTEHRLASLRDPKDYTPPSRPLGRPGESVVLKPEELPPNQPTEAECTCGWVCVGSTYHEALYAWQEHRDVHQ